MEFKQLLKKEILVVISAIILFSITLSISEIFLEKPTIAYASENVAEINTVQEFETALKNKTITTINVNKSIQLKCNIVDIPNRDVTINGNKQNGVVINSGHYSIYGKQNYNGTNIFSVKNIKIIGADNDGRFFTGGAGNGPSSYGWNVDAEDVHYTGARFVHLSEGKLRFSGKDNNVNTRAENAWVHDLEFLPGTIYNGVAANKDHGQFSAFYFNGALIKGKATGEAIIGDNANINVKIGPQSTVNHYYPVFYDKVQKVDVGEDAVFNVDAAGVAFQFIPRADYVNKVPTFNLAKGSKVHLNGRGGGNYSTIKLQYYGAEVNLEPNAELIVVGDSSKSVIESEYKGVTINLRNPTNFEVANRRPNSKLFYSTNTKINGANIDCISAWKQIGGEYQTPAAESFQGGQGFTIDFGKLCDSKTLFIMGDLSGNQKFSLEDYGKLSLKGAEPKQEEPEKPIENTKVVIVTRHYVDDLKSNKGFRFYKEKRYTVEEGSYVQINSYKLDFSFTEHSYVGADRGNFIASRNENPKVINYRYYAEVDF
ncbi:hypothetical protein JZO66_14420 [Enterococcus sp. DIV0242_7C1]|uniref:Uncharacterized protein n=2 Tax=Candidatus Enterococcus dunnyi TaxID=1834192 RepID=A0AAQ3W3U4_9ENTE|nr:pectate lyase-like adhesive domain-containing protein [Enterococcus sp. DIV0242_7C1]MBO0471750.1 hypothetical protein [Enterococcus sp. DIV0242_7C1]